MKRKTTEEFVSDAKKVHGERYDYSRTEYANSYSDVEIGCCECGRYFWQRAGHHLEGAGCRPCGVKNNGVKPTMDLPTYIAAIEKSPPQYIRLLAGIKNIREVRVIYRYWLLEARNFQDDCAKTSCGKDGVCGM